jgi:hypothetical protein
MEAEKRMVRRSSGIAESVGRDGVSNVEWGASIVFGIKDVGSFSA